MQQLFKVPSSDLGPDSSPYVKWSRDSKYLACFGNTDSVFVYDRAGNKIMSIPSPNPKFLEWDNQSKFLVVASSTSNEVTIVQISKKEVQCQTAPFILTWGQCSKRASLFAGGSDKGKFWILDLASGESQVYQGSHDSTIVDGAWNRTNQLALCSRDNSISVSSVQGTEIARKEIGDVPNFVHFLSIEGSPTLIFAGTRSPFIYLWDYSQSGKLTKLKLESSNGKIIKCTTLSNSLIYVQFSSGQYQLISFSAEVVLERIAFNSTINKVDAVQAKAIVGSIGSIKLISLEDTKNIVEEQTHFPNDYKVEISALSLSSDGTFGAIGFCNGNILVYLVEIPILSASSGPTSVYCQTLTSLTIFDMHKKQHKQIRVESQPQKLGVCLSKVAVSFNNKCWFYNAKTADFLVSYELSSTIDAIQVSDTAYAVMMNGKVMLNYFDESRRPFHFPDFETSSRVTSFSLTGFLLLLATDDGTVRIFNTRNQTFLDQYKHHVAITMIKPNLSETRFVFIDAQHGVFLFNPIKRSAQEVPTEKSSLEAETALFDITDRNVFAIISPKAVSIFHFTDHNVSGPIMSLLSHNRIPSMKSALGLSNGTLIFLDSQSNQQKQVLSSHDSLNEDTPERVEQLLQLNRHRSALQAAIKLGNKSLIKKVGDAALSSLSVEIAAEAYSSCGDAASYNILNPIRHEEEYSFLRGYVSMLNRDFNTAQKYFLESTRPYMALDMRAALLQFDSALNLAEKFDPSRIPQLSHDSARQNELTGNYTQAIQQYKVSHKTPGLSKSSRAGIIRCLILAGKVEQGMKQLEKTKDINLITECARILERLSAFGHAATLYNQVRQYNSAAQCYMRAGDLKSASELVSKVDDSKVLRNIGKQLERAGQLEAASISFERANDWDSLVRVLLKVNLDRATSIARAHPSTDSCRQVAEHCIQLGNFRYAIEFLIIAGRADDAFRVAELHQRMDEFADLIGTKGTSTQYEAIASYFCNKNQQFRAAKFFSLASDYNSAMNCYLSDGSDESMEGALILAESVTDRNLRDLLLDFLSANVKENTKNLRYLLRMFIIMKQFDEAAETASRIADELRNRGEYRASRDLLFDIISQLQKSNFPVSADMRKSLMIIHSYLQIKPTKEKDPIMGALLLRRISKYASMFPAHAHTILVSTVVECSRVGMKKSAFEAASKLVTTPEYESKIKPDIMTKIKQTVRHKNTSEIEEPRTPCPICNSELPISELFCGSCKTNIPYDSFTGMHMNKNDWSECPSCHYTASHSLMCQEKKCPLCHESIPVPELIQNPKI